MEIKGKLLQKGKTEQKTEKFSKREFVIETSYQAGQNTYPNFIKFQLINDRCDLIDAYNEGQLINVTFDIRGRKWEKEDKVEYFTNLEAWKIQPVQNMEGIPDNAKEIPPELEDDQDLPF